MATEEQKNVLEGDSSEVLSDGAIFTDKAQKQNLKEGLDLSDWGVREQLTEHDLFAGEEDLYQLLADSAADTVTSSTFGTTARLVSSRFLKYYNLHKKFSILQKVIAVSILAVVAMLLYGLLNSPSEQNTGLTPASTEQSRPFVEHSPALKSPAADSSQQIMQKNIQVQAPVLSPGEPLSLNVARNFFRQMKYDNAYVVYNQLQQTLPASDKMMKDFLQLEMALCAKEVGDFEQASRLLIMVSESQSPVVRIVANYHLSQVEIQRKRYLRARTRAYNTIALIKAVDFNDDWALSFECDCYFLAAECLTRHILMLGNSETNLPGELWSNQTLSEDPFANLGETELRNLLNSGSEHLNAGLLDPKVRRLEHQSGLPRWSVASYGASIEEMLGKFAANAELDVHWAFEGTSEPDSGGVGIRQRPVCLYLPAATSHQIVLIAAGCAGLLAQLENSTDRQKVTIYDPTEYASLKKHISFLSEQAISLWQTFVLTFFSDKRIGNAHFAMGLLQSLTGLPTEAIAEYKLVANRFSQMSLAPYALLHSSKLKANLLDYHGSREDLRQLIEQYPETEIYGQAYLSLADSTMKAGLDTEAARLFQRVYNFGLSLDSKTTSALGAARCFYQVKAYEEAVKWLNRYISLAADSENSSLYSAYFMLGKANLELGKYKQACDAFQKALTVQNSREQYIDAITALVQGHIEQEHFVEAFDTIENVRSVALSQEQSIEILLLKSRVFRMLGLVDAAIVSLRDRAEFVSDSQLNARISFELTQCHIAKGNLELARGSLIEILGIVEPGPLAQMTALELADVCLKLGRSQQTITVCLQLLDSDIPGEVKQQALKMLAEAYNQQKNYDKAALALSGRWK